MSMNVFGRDIELDDFQDFVFENRFFIGALAVFSLALFIRYLPEQGMQYLQALDPYMIYRMSQHLALEGFLPQIDFMRYFPYATPTYTLNLGNIYLPAIIYWLGPFLFFENYMEWAQFYPALMGAFGVLATYFLGKELFDRFTGLSSAFFLATIAGVMHRTSAGFFEKEPTGSLFMILSLYFFTRAYRRTDWMAGILGGISMAVFTVSWGGSKMLWLLYPMVTGLILLLNEDIEKLLVSYTPIVLIGGIAASAWNPSRFWITWPYFLANLGMLALLWSRYMVEEFELVEKEYLKYYTPGVSVLGGIALALSPLVYPKALNLIVSLYNSALQKTGADVVAGTVAENTPATLNQLIGQLGALGAANVLNTLSPAVQQFLGLLRIVITGLANLVGVWPLAFIGIVLLGTKLTTMLLVKADILDSTVSGANYAKIIASVTFVWTLTFSVLFQQSIALVVGPSILAIGGGLLLLHSFEGLKPRKVEFDWLLLLPLLWGVTNILGAVMKSRLIFLAAFPAAFIAGYGFSQIYSGLKDMEKRSVMNIGAVAAVAILDIVFISVLVGLGVQPIVAVAAIVALNGVLVAFSGEETIQNIYNRIPETKAFYSVLGLFVGLVVVINFASGFSAASGLGGSPNQLWMQNLDYMESETPQDSVILSWWDYGYWFESIGRRAAVADGGNAGYYADGRKINYPLADFLTSTNPNSGNNTEFLEKHSVDYVVLDETMIGKYSAVSQIARETNQDYRAMRSLQTNRDIRRSISGDPNSTERIITYRGRYINGYLPISSSNGSLDVYKAPLLEFQGRNDVGCYIDESGVTEYDVENPATVPYVLFGGPQGENVEVCLAMNPYYNLDRSLQGLASGQLRRSELVVVPKPLAETTLVQLYLMDGANIDWAEKVPEGSNGFVKMWKVNLE